MAGKENNVLNNPILVKLEELTQEEFNSGKGQDDRSKRTNDVNEIARQIPKNLGTVYKGIIEYYALKEDYTKSSYSNNMDEKDELENKLKTLSQNFQKAIDNETNEDVRDYMKSLIIMRISVINLTPMELTFKNTQQAENYRNETAKDMLKNLAEKGYFRGIGLYAELKSQEVSLEDSTYLNLLAPAVKEKDPIATALFARVFLGNYSSNLGEKKSEKSIDLQKTLTIPKGLSEKDITGAIKELLDNGNEGIATIANQFSYDIFKSLVSLHQQGKTTPKEREQLIKVAEIALAISNNNLIKQGIREMLDLQDGTKEKALSIFTRTINSIDIGSENNVKEMKDKIKVDLDNLLGEIETSISETKNRQFKGETLALQKEKGKQDRLLNNFIDNLKPIKENLANDLIVLNDAKTRLNDIAQGYKNTKETFEEEIKLLENVAEENSSRYKESTVKETKKEQIANHMFTLEDDLTASITLLQGEISRLSQRKNESNVNDRIELIKSTVSELNNLEKRLSYQKEKVRSEAVTIKQGVDFIAEGANNYVEITNKLNEEHAKIDGRHPTLGKIKQSADRMLQKIKNVLGIGNKSSNSAKTTLTKAGDWKLHQIATAAEKSQRRISTFFSSIPEQSKKPAETSSEEAKSEREESYTTRPKKT
ncbi:MAG: hypothetical protein ACX932_03890 [Gammaproteobacteria bacterium]